MALVFTTQQGLLHRNACVPSFRNLHFISRSQPPFFTLMVWDLYYKCSIMDDPTEIIAEIGLEKPSDIISEFLPELKTEYDWWSQHRSLELSGFPTEIIVNRYASPVTVNRPGLFSGVNFYTVKLNFTFLNPNIWYLGVY